MTNSHRGILLLGTALYVGMASAQEAADPYFLGTLRIDTQAAQNLLGNDEITEEEIEERNPTTVADVFNGESSVTTSGGAAIAQKIFVNGIEESLWSVGVFAQARQNLSDRVSVSYGGSIDRQEFKGADGSRFSDTGVSLNGAIALVLTDTLSLNAGPASSWGGFELGEAALIDFGGAWDDTGFQSSRGNAARIWLRHDSGPWAVSGALFHTAIDDIAAVLPAGGARGELSDLTTCGFDGSVSWTGDQAFARLNYTYADVELDGDPISTTAFYQGRCGVSLAAARCAGAVPWLSGG